MINSRAYSAILFAALSAFVPTLNGRMMTTPKSRSFEMLNKSGKKLVVEWVNPLTGEMVPLADSANGEHTKFNSFVNHTFAIHESQDTCRAGGEGGCEVRFVTISEQDEQGKNVLFQQSLGLFGIRLTQYINYKRNSGCCQT